MFKKLVGAVKKVAKKVVDVVAKVVSNVKTKATGLFGKLFKKVTA